MTNLKSECSPASKIKTFELSQMAKDRLSFISECFGVHHGSELIKKQFQLVAVLAVGILKQGASQETLVWLLFRNTQ